MLVWDTSLNRFAEFGSNQEIGLESNQYPYVEKLSLACSRFDPSSTLFHSQGSKGGS